MNIKLPERVSWIIDLLNSEGYAAYVVGGCVRDSLLNNTPHDWDICTSAKPEESAEVFRKFGYKVVETGAKYGTITVILSNSWQVDEPFEITTFRIDGEYKDNRRPDEVQFTDDLTADLSRRDFTINAMAYHPKYGLVDPFDGKKDLENGIVRCVGDPEQRFTEDALRLLRAVRFALRYTFDIDDDTYRAIIKMKDNIKTVSAERISSELYRILKETNFAGQSKNGKPFLAFMQFVGMVSCMEKPKSLEINTYMDLAICQNDIGAMLAVLFDCDSIVKTLKDLKFSNEIIYQAVEARRIGQLILGDHHLLVADGKDFRYGTRKLICEAHGVFQILYSALSYAMANAGKIPISYLIKLEKQIIDSHYHPYPVSVKELAVNGDDLIALGYSGKEIGKLLEVLLNYVLYEFVKNEKEQLIRLIREMEENKTLYLLYDIHKTNESE